MKRCHYYGGTSIFHQDGHMTLSQNYFWRKLSFGASQKNPYFLHHFSLSAFLPYSPTLNEQQWDLFQDLNLPKAWCYFSKIYYKEYLKWRHLATTAD